MLRRTQIAANPNKSPPHSRLAVSEDAATLLLISAKYRISRQSEPWLGV
jgi:hypothetical protein